MKKRVRRAVTLIEMIVVMTLIAIITSAITYNYQASLERGRAFKTEEIFSRIETALTLAVATENLSAQSVKDNWKAYVVKSPLWSGSRDPEKIVDGWGDKIDVNEEDQGGEKHFKCSSKRYTEYQEKTKVKTKVG